MSRIALVIIFIIFPLSSMGTPGEGGHLYTDNTGLILHDFKVLNWLTKNYVYLNEFKEQFLTNFSSEAQLKITFYASKSEQLQCHILVTAPNITDFSFNVSTTPRQGLKPKRDFVFDENAVLMVNSEMYDEHHHYDNGSEPGFYEFKNLNPALQKNSTSRKASSSDYDCANYGNTITIPVISVCAVTYNLEYCSLKQQRIEKWYLDGSAYIKCIGVKVLEQKGLHISNENLKLCLGPSALQICLEKGKNDPCVYITGHLKINLGFIHYNKDFSVKIFCF